MVLRLPARVLVHAVGALCLSLAWAATGAAQGVDPLDWPNWRGPQQNRISTEKGLIESWNPDGGEGSNVVWMNEELAGRTSPIVLRGKLYTIVRDQPETANEGEMVVCADAATGEIIWRHRFNVYLSDVPDTRIGWSTPAADPETGRVYVLGVCGYFCCLDGETGEVIWDRSLHEEYGLISTYGGRTNTPLVFEDMVLISAVVVGWGDTPQWDGLARPAHRFLCFDKATGELRWLAGTSISPFDTTYSTPTIMPIAGQQAMVFSSGDGGVWALQPRTGKPIWNYPLSRAGVNVSPLVATDGRVFVSHAQENAYGTSMGAVVALDGTKTGDLAGSEIWKKYEVVAGFSSPILIDERLYVVDDGAKLLVLNAETGEQITRRPLGTAHRDTPLYADGKIYVCTNGGRWYILRPSENGVEIVHRLRLNDHEVTGSMAVSRGRIYFPTSRGMYCLGLPGQVPSADPLPPMPAEDPVANDPTPAQLQVIPYDTLLAPGGSQSYSLRLFNSRGQLLREVPAGDATFALEGRGTISDSGEYAAPADGGHECALVTVKVGDLTGKARVRIVPPLPWAFDFNGRADVPLSWIGGRVRWEVRDDGGERYIAKKTLLPTPRDPNNKLGTRSFIWMGPIDLTDYTIQGDVLLTKDSSGRISDVGLINSRYQLTVRGINEKLRLDTWAPSDYRTSAEADFQPEPGVWYTLKLSVSPSGDGKTTTAKGKIWRRGDDEPNEWTVEMVDHMPNLFGTPGVYGNTPEAEVYLDNLAVTPN